MIRAVTVYCSSSTDVDPVFSSAAEDLGTAIALAGWTLVYGGNRIGVMGRMADAARAADGRVVGITPQLFIDKGAGDDRCHELVVTNDMRDRKALLEERGDAFIALPGGIGTLEEIFEILVGRQLGYHDKPIVLVNIAGFYDPLLEMLDRGIESNFIRSKIRGLYHVSDTVPAAIEYLMNASRPVPVPHAPKAATATVMD